MDITDGLKKIIEREDLTREEARSCMESIMSDAATDAQKGAFLAALRMKGETIDEITGCVEVMREKVSRVDINIPGAVDTCGTGGDGTGTINVSTLSAIAAAGAGAKVAKHGNRSVSSSCGSADLLESLGVCISLAPDQVAECIEKTGIGFMFAPGFHAAMKHAIGPRREMKIRTVFNILGPLTNPAGVKRQVMGVFSETLVEPIAHVLKNLGTEEAIVVHGTDGVDEISISGPTSIARLQNGSVALSRITPGDFGIAEAVLPEITADSPEENKEIALGILEGSVTGPKRDVVIMNTAAALVVSGIAPNFKEGAEKAAEAIDSGAASKILDELIAVSNSFK